MLAEMNVVVQALVWITLAGLLYMVWLYSQTTSGIDRLILSSYTQRVMQLLRTLWVLMAIGLIISLIVFAYPRSSQARLPVPNCATGASTSYTLTGFGQAANGVCSDNSAGPP